MRDVLFLAGAFVMAAEPWWPVVQEALWLAAVLAAPAAAAALGAGLLVAMVQTVTNVREPTAPAAPRAAAALAAVLLTGVWMADQWVRFARLLFLAIEGVCA